MSYLRLIFNIGIYTNLWNQIIAIIIAISKLKCKCHHVIIGKCLICQFSWSTITFIQHLECNSLCVLLSFYSTSTCYCFCFFSLLLWHFSIYCNICPTTSLGYISCFNFTIHSARVITVFNAYILYGF